MVGEHHRLDGHESEQAPGEGEGQGSLVCCSPWGRKESDRTVWLNSNQSSVNRVKVFQLLRVISEVLTAPQIQNYQKHEFQVKKKKQAQTLKKIWKYDYISSSSQTHWETIWWSNNVIRLEKPDARNEILTVALLKVIPLLVQGFSAQTQATKDSQSAKCSSVSGELKGKTWALCVYQQTHFFF